MKGLAPGADLQPFAGVTNNDGAVKPFGVAKKSKQ